jgi:hypothetical protein
MLLNALLSDLAMIGLSFQSEGSPIGTPYLQTKTAIAKLGHKHFMHFFAVFFIDPDINPEVGSFRGHTRFYINWQISLD